MKFLALKSELERWETNQREDEPKVVEPIIPVFRPFKRVEGGIDRIPIDRTARLVIQKAPWWALPTMKTITTTEEPINTRIEGRLKTDQEVTSEVCSHAVRDGTKAMDRSLELYQKSCDARAALEVLSTEWKVAWMDFMDTANKRLNDFRMTRMAITSEADKLMKEFKEVRQFFLDKDYDVEVARLKEFVSLCERLQKLKESGFLDTVADTMLKLSK